MSDRAHCATSPASLHHFPAQTLESLSDPARSFAIRFRNSCINRNREWMHIAEFHIAKIAECKNNQVNGLLSELKASGVLTIRKDGDLLRLTLVKQIRTN